MKRIIFILVLLSFLTSCEDLREGIMESPANCSYFPQNDTFKVGDTLWICLSFPIEHLSDCGTYVFTKDTLQVIISNWLKVKYFNTVFDSNRISLNYPVFTRAGKYDGYNSIYYFEKNENTFNYKIDLGIVLADTGKIAFGTLDDYILFFTNERINKKSNPIFATIKTNFAETGKGYFSIYVKP